MRTSADTTTSFGPTHQALLDNGPHALAGLTLTEADIADCTIRLARAAHLPDALFAQALNIPEDLAGDLRRLLTAEVTR